jgi:hypothetical protein
MRDEHMKDRPRVVLVGGFLGARKTTLLVAASRELDRRGMRSALVLNDQGDELVDTGFVSIQGLLAKDVKGGCFCCRFSDLVRKIDELAAFSPGVIFAEPVGSCTDLSATTVNPLLQNTGKYAIAPYTVLVDPARAKALSRPDADSNLKFLFDNQLAEADLVCFTKADIHPDISPIAHGSVRQISAKTGQGVAAWLDDVLLDTIYPGTELLAIDYEQYARAEAALAWLNASAVLRSERLIASSAVLPLVLDRIDADCTGGKIEIVHLKGLMRSEFGFLKGAICANRQSPTWDGLQETAPSATHNILLNLRAVGRADAVRRIVEQSLVGLPAVVSDLQIASFHPAPPQPERRVTSRSSP